MASRSAGGIHRLGTDWVNWYVVEQDSRLTIVDAGLPGYGGQLEAALGELGKDIRAVEAIVLTHGHFDHTGFAARLARDTGLPVLIHRDDVRLAAGLGLGRNENLLLPYLKHAHARRFLTHCARKGGLLPHGVKDPRTFAGGDRLDVPGRPLAVHAPGHTAGQCALHFEDHGALLMGDVLCTRNPLTGAIGPQILPSALNRSSDEALRSLDAFEALDAGTLLFGHGEPFRGTPADAVARARATGTT